MTKTTDQFLWCYEYDHGDGADYDFFIAGDVELEEAERLALEDFYQKFEVELPEFALNRVYMPFMGAYKLVKVGED